MKKKIFSLKKMRAKLDKMLFCNIIYCDRKAQKPANLDRKLSPELHPTLPTPAGPFFRGEELLLSSRP